MRKSKYDSSKPCSWCNSCPVSMCDCGPCADTTCAICFSTYENTLPKEPETIDKWPTAHPYFVTGSTVRNSEVKAWEAGKEFGKAQLSEAVLKERERCLEICRSRAKMWDTDRGSVPSEEAKAWAHDEAIRIHDLIKKGKGET